MGIDYYASDNTTFSKLKPTVILQNDFGNMYPNVWNPNLNIYLYMCLHMS